MDNQVTIYTHPDCTYSEALKDELKEDEEYKQYIANAKTIQEQNARKSEVFMEKTNNVFNEFKGFEFNIDDNKIVFSPGDAEEIKKSQLDPNNFVSKFLDEDGMMKDAEGYHRSLAMAMNPEKFAKFFYEQGKSSAADEQMKKLKNIHICGERVVNFPQKNIWQIKI